MATGVPMKYTTGVPMKYTTGVRMKYTTGVPMKYTTGVPMKYTIGVPVKYTTQRIDFLLESALSIYDIQLETRVFAKSQYQLRPLKSD